MDLLPAKNAINLQNGEIWLDISRILYRISCGKITGIDRVEVAYAEQLTQDAARRTRFVAYDYWRGTFRMLPHGKTCGLIRDFAPAWHSGAMAPLQRRAFSALAGSVFAAPRVPSYRGGARPVYVNVSSHPLHLVERIGRMVKRSGALFVPLVHDLIPLELPEYVPPPWTRHHRARLRTIRDYADGIISNSGSTTESLRRYVDTIPIATVPLGIRPLTPDAVAPRAHPYFVMLGTIEPRKNHLMILQLWRRLVQKLGPQAPHLFVIGRRGWENEQVLDLLERSASLREHVFETGMIPDGGMARLVAGARALLMPSFAEGYGLPIAEAMAIGVPVICSDIAAHREVGKGVPECLDPLDALSWMRVILDYAAPDSAARAAQCARLKHWPAPDWANHVGQVLAFVAQLEPRRELPQSSWSRMMFAISMANTQAMKPASAASTITSQRTG